jgi:hypothetical protein
MSPNAGGGSCGVLANEYSCTQSRKFNSRHGARNRFQEPSLELSSEATYMLAGRYDNPMHIWFLAPIAGHKLPTQEPEFLCPNSRILLIESVSRFSRFFGSLFSVLVSPSSP